ncbi:amidohydrolase [Calycomorphotria hydatis]|uniref:Uncharacterized protein n=1 Tax=Calycomorphotria hydatis TaxID=2528027 RepID=A0A517TDB3_9PLAN|nr:amidohydrolase [Calycomorphotria hydatis]QDT66357.1 hypothetical protein V22_36230 [Calycomorphotria hydatis]
MPNSSPTPAELIAESQYVMAHAWMVRTFLKHSEESEEFPELLEMARAIFDLCRALETRLDDQTAYFRMLRKKLGKFRKAAEKFRVDAPEVSTHMNFEQAVISVDGCVIALEQILEQGEEALRQQVPTS